MRRRVEGETWMVDRAGFELPILVPELPREVAFGFLGRVLPTHESSGLRLQAHPMTKSRSLDVLEGAGATAEAELAEAHPSATARTADLELEAESARTLARRIASGDEGLFRVGLCLHAHGPGRARVELARHELGRRLAALGFRTRIPRFEAGEAGSPPDLAGTEARPSGYWHTLPTEGLAAFFPFADESVIEPGGVLVGLLLDDASPVLLDRWSHSSHSWGIFGATGSGKSFAASLLSLRSRWQRPELELYLIDPLGEFGRLARALGGQVVRPGVAGGPRINPLDGGAGSEGAEQAARATSVLRALFPTLAAEEVAALDAAVSRTYAGASGAPTFSDLLHEVEALPAAPARLRGLLEVGRSGSLAHLDGPTTLDWAVRPIVFDLVGVAEAQLPFYLAFLLHAIYGRLRASDRPKLVVIDEAHLLARLPATAEFLDRLVRHVRHFRAGHLIASQNPDDILRS